MIGENRKLALVVLAAVIAVGLTGGAVVAACTTVGSDSYEDVVVSGAGTTAANGTYVFFGMWESKPEYRIDVDRAVYWNTASGKWAIAVPGLPFAYTCTSTADTPPSSVWDVGTGAPNAPTLSGGEDCSATPGITVSAISGDTTEGGGTATFTVVLDTNPTDDVTIDISSSNTTEGTVSPDSLTFTTSNWASAQTVTVTGVDDPVDDGDVGYFIATDAATSGDGDYSGMNADDVGVTNTDDDTRGVTVSGISGNTTEAGGTATFTVVLDTNPTDDVTIGISSNNTDEGTVSPDSLTFTTVDWATPQTVTVAGVDDDVDDGDVAYNIVTAAATGGGDYAGLNASDVSVTNTDNDTKGITVTPVSGPALTTTEAGGDDTLTVVLNSEPTASVTIGISSDDITEGTVSPDSLTFTTVNWASAQTVTVTGVDDNVDDGEVIYFVVTAAATGGDYASVDPNDVTVTNTDDDTRGITVDPTAGLTTTEGGADDTFTVVLNTEPTASVTIGISSNDTTEGTVSPASLTFTTGNWATPQTVTVTGVDDGLDDGDVAYSIITAAATGGDYGGVNPSDVSVTNIDDEAPGITVTPVSGPALTTTEAGGADTLTVVLDTEPTADVTIGISSDDLTEGTVSPMSLTFTVVNWDSEQTVTVTGVDDDVDDGDVVYTIVTAPAVSGDGDYSGMNANDVTVTNTDDDTRGITVDPIFGLTTTEAGPGSDAFTVVLDTQPTASVTIGISSDDTSEGTVSPTSLTFTVANWATPQIVTVTGVNDDVDDGDVGYLILTAAATGGDYAAFNPDDADVTNIDDDTAGITVTPTSGLTTTEAGGAATFTVVLNTEPTATVTTGISSSDTTEGTVSPTSLDFTAANWNVPQTVTVTGVDDGYSDGDRGYSIVTAPAVSSDPPYDGLNAADVAVTNVDDDVPGITVTPTSGLRTTEAGGTATFTVVLDTRPMFFAEIGISSDDTTEGTVSPTMLFFDQFDWDTPKTVTVTGVDDDVYDGDVGYTIVTHPAFGFFPDYDGLDAADVHVANLDDDVPPPPDLLVIPGGAGGEGSILDRVLPLEEGEEPPIVGGKRLYAIYEIGEPITGELMLTDGSGHPIRNSFVIVELYCLDLSCVPHTCVRVVNSMIRYDRDYRTYHFSIDTTDCSPGYYDFVIAFSDGTSMKCRIQLIEPTP